MHNREATYNQIQIITSASIHQTLALIINNKKNWLVILTDHELPNYLQDVAQLDKNFNFASHLDSKTIIEVLKNINYYLSSDSDQPIREKLSLSLNSHIKNTIHEHHTEKLLSQNIKRTNSFLKEHEDFRFQCR